MSHTNQAITLLNYAYETSPLCQFALKQAQAYTHKIIDDQTYLLNQNQLLWSHNQYNLNQYDFQTKLINRIDQDLIYLNKLNHAVSNYGEPGEFDLTWSLATTKMNLILNGARHIILNDDYFTDLLTGQISDLINSDIPPNYIVSLGESSALFGNSNLSYLNAAILITHLGLLGDQSHVQDILIENTPWIDQAAIAHITPIPNSIQVDSNFSYLYADNQTTQGLAFVHSGYAFGGQRDENRYGDNGKLYGPEDCSSWMAKVIHSDVSFSTIDMLYAFRMAQPESERGYIEPDWLKSDYAKIMDYITPVVIHDPVQDIQPGMIWVNRKFEAGIDHHSSSGKSGHTALVLGLEESGEVLTVGYARDMPKYEGFGLKSFSAQSTSDSEVMYFSVKQPMLAIQDILKSDDHLFSDENLAVKINTSPEQRNLLFLLLTHTLCYLA